MSKNKFIAVAVVSLALLLGAFLFNGHSAKRKQTVVSSEASKDSASEASEHSLEMASPARSARAKSVVENPARSGHVSKIADRADKDATNKLPSSRERAASASKSSAGNPDQGPNAEELLVTSQDGSDGKQALNLNAAKSIISSENFDDTVQSLQDKAKADTTIAELNDTYRSIIVNQLEQTIPSATLSEFACGIQICIGEIYLAQGQEGSSSDWSNKLTEDERTSAMIQGDKADSFGNIQRRFVISIDPNINGIKNSTP